MVGHVYVKSGGAWVEPTNLYVKTGGAWVGALEGWVKTAGVWQQFWPQVAGPTLDLDFTTGTLDSRVTLTRSTTATRVNASGLVASAAINAARFDYNPSTLVARGLLLEEQRTNDVLRNRDLTQAVWTKTNVTALKNVAGADGVANSASRITASAANGTCLQTITAASAQRAQSAWVKRLTGTGTVNMTMDNGATWTVITVTAAWLPVTIPVQTFTNPRVGFRLVTSGDAIAVDYVQNEVGPFATSSIPTTTAAVTRAADSASMTGTNFSSWYNASEGTFVLDMTDPQPGISAHYLNVNNSASPGSDRIVFFNPTSTDFWSYIDAGGANQHGGSIGSIATTGFKAALALKVNDVAPCLNGAAPTTDTSVTLPTVDRLFFLTDESGVGSRVRQAWVKRLTYYNVRRTNAELQTLTT